MQNWNLILGILAVLVICPVESVQAATGPCAELDLRKVLVGSECKTTKGVEFKLISRDATSAAEVWKDKTSGLTWYDTLPQAGDHNYAINTCTLDLKLNLPIVEDFKTGEAHGFREVLPNSANKAFWSLSVHPNDTDGAYAFSGKVGRVGFVPRGVNLAVRCVER